MTVRRKIPDTYKMTLAAKCFWIGPGQVGIRVTEPDCSLVEAYCLATNAPKNVKVGDRGKLHWELQKGLSMAVFTRS